ncbi:MAG: sugar phosphate isomerase/epimerase [Phycisphaerae bacterium]|nr:sugar phosphate isomerase/epimerase [Phycisphaerae bacterium]
MSTLEIGVLVHLSDKVEESLANVTDLGLRACQICSWQSEVWTDERADALRAQAAAAGVKIATFWAGYGGPCEWNFYGGPKTIGLVPDAYRAGRVAELKKAADFAARAGIGSITTHVGFLPEDPNDPLFTATVVALREIATHCKAKGLDFLFETGQETPVNLLRTIEEVGTGNLGINLDPANLILYGKANPVDALEVFGTFVRQMHAKDGLYPTNGKELGQETPLGEGLVNFPKLMPKLKALGFTGVVAIEREISGPKQIEDIKKAIALLKPLC